MTFKENLGVGRDGRTGKGKGEEKEKRKGKEESVRWREV